MSDAPANRYPWLGADAAQWVGEHPGVLDAAYAAFRGSGQWPDPVQLDRTLRQQGRAIGLATSIGSMPPDLGWRQHGPDQLRLSLFALGCVPVARDLLGLYLKVIRLALDRYDDADRPNRLTRDEVTSRLNLEGLEATCLSQLIVSDGVWTNGGQASVDGWDFAIDPRVTAFDEVTDVDGFLDLLAKQRGQRPTREAPRDVETEGAITTADSAHAGLGGPALVLVGALGIGASIVGVLTAPLPAIVGVSAALVLAVILHRPLLRTPPEAAAIAAVLTVGVAAAGAAYAVAGKGHSEANGPSPITGFSGGCAPYRVYAQGRWDPRGTAIRSAPDAKSTQQGSFPANMSITVNGWVHARAAYPTNQPPFNSDTWFHLADGAGWVAFGGVRETPVSYDPTGLSDGGPPAATPPSCRGAIQ